MKERPRLNTNYGSGLSGEEDSSYTFCLSLTSYDRILISMDRMISTILGRPSAIGDEEYVPPPLQVSIHDHCYASFDLDYPLEVDDEYWDHPDPDQSWKQPPNKPSLITAFSYHLRLTHILGLASRALVRGPIIAYPLLHS